MNTPAFSIVVPTYQRRDTVCDAVRAIARIEYAGPLELIVVVDGSDDGTADALRQLDCPFPFSTIEQTNAGAASARNKGAAAAQGDILLFLDDDMICRPDIVEQHARSHREGADAVLGDLPLDPDSPPGLLSAAIGRWSATRTRQLANGADLTLFDLLTGQLSVRRTVFEEIGGFDGKFTRGGTFGNEDLDLGARLLDRYTVRFNPDAVSYQRYVVGYRQHLRQWYQAGQADVAFGRKHPTRATELFELHGASTWRARLYMYLAHMPPLVRLLSRFSVRVPEVGWGYSRWTDRLVGSFFFAVRDIVYWSGVRSQGGMPADRPVLVLCYHAIADLSADSVLAQYGIEPTAFAAHLDRLLSQGFRFISADELGAYLEGLAGVPRKAVLLTFDDCYAELLDVAKTLLEPRGIPALAFAISAMTTNTNEWDQAIGASTLPLMARADLADLMLHGVAIGCHSRSHRAMPTLSEQELAGETTGAMEELSSSGVPRPRFFAYPYGEVDEKSRATVRRAGFLAGFGLRRGRATRRSDPMNLPRVEILAMDRGWRFWVKTNLPGLASHLS